MHITVPKSALIDLLTPAIGAVEKRSTTPILSSVLIEARRDNTLTITATNKAVTFRGSSVVDVRVPGSVCVDADNLWQVVKAAAPDAVIDVSSADGQRVRVKAKGFESKLNAYAAADFPVAPEVKGPREMTVDAADLARVIDQVLPDIAAEENRYGLNGAHVEVVNGNVRFVATDGNRLAWAEIPFTGELGIGRNQLLPRAALAQIRKLLTAGPVVFRWVDRACEFVAPNRSLHVRLLEAEFPDYRQVLPTSYKRKVTADRAEFAGAVTATKIFAVDGANSIRFEFAADTCRMSSRKLDAGDARNEVAADLVGDPIDIGLNAVFLLSALSGIRGPTVAIEMGDALSPVVIRDPADASCLFVVMPIRLS